MNCCTECFYDNQIRAMIATNNQIGDCSFCGSKNIPIYSLNEQSDLTDMLSDVINVYEEDELGQPIIQLLINHWNIFDKEKPSSATLIQTICNIIYGNEVQIYNMTASIPHHTLENYGIFGGHCWQDFSSTIKTQNRFHSGYFKSERFSSFLDYSKKQYTKGTVLYRARIWSGNKGYNINELGAPPFIKRRAGRVNPEGIGVLYLTSDEETALSEVRASAYDYVSVGQFKLLKDITIINISGMSSISPFVYTRGLDSFAANFLIFGDIAKEIAKPLRRNDSPLEYLPTQFITEFIKSQGYAGVEFASTMATGGNNIAVFDESLFTCVDVHDVEIKRIDYSIENVPR